MAFTRSSVSLILASQSPRRRQLLAAFHIPFQIDSAGIDESVLPQETPLPHALRLAETKARVVASRHPRAFVLAADTIVVQYGRILGKPDSAAEARRMLRALRADPHQVITAVALALPESENEDGTLPADPTPTLPEYPVAATSYRILTASHSSRVTMRPYSDAEIDAYVASGDPLDKAGAYAIQHDGFRPVACFQGCYASIMGLPLGVVADLLAAAGWPPQSHWPRACATITGQCCQPHAPESILDD